MKCNEILMKCHVVTGSIAINFAGISFCLPTAIPLSTHRDDVCLLLTATQPGQAIPSFPPICSAAVPHLHPFYLLSSPLLC